MGRVVGGRRHLPVRPLEDAGADLRDRHTAADGEREPAHRSRVLLHAHGRDRALPAYAGQDGLLSDGVGRQRAADRAACAELLRCPMRSIAPVRPASSTSTPSTGPTASWSRCRGRTSSSSASGSPSRMSSAFEDVFRRTGLSVDWTQTYTNDRRAFTPGLAALVRSTALEGPGLQGRGTDDVGRRLPDRGCAGGDRGSRDRRRVPPRAVRPRGRSGLGGDRDVAPRADPRVRGPGREPVRRAVPGCRRLVGRDAAVRSGGPDPRPRACRPREGDGHRHDLHVRRPHGRHVVARAPVADPGRDRPRWEDRAVAVGGAGVGDRGTSSRPD